MKQNNFSIITPNCSADSCQIVINNQKVSQWHRLIINVAILYQLTHLLYKEYLLHNTQ